jgi:hypothetical protein
LLVWQLGWFTSAAVLAIICRPVCMTEPKARSTLLFPGCIAVVICCPGFYKRVL